MRGRWTVVAAIVLGALVGPSTATAGHGPRVVGDPGRSARLLKSGFKTLLALPAARNPLVGNGDPCVRTGTHNTLTPIALGSDVDCTLRFGETLGIIAIAGECSNVESPPYYAPDAAGQRACAIANDVGYVDALPLSIDGGPAIDLHQSRYEVITHQGHVVLPAANVLGVPAGRASFVAHGWGALVKGLGIGRHTIHTAVVGGPSASDATLTIDVRAA